MRCDPARDQNFVEVILIKGEYGSFFTFLLLKSCTKYMLRRNKRKLTKLVYNIEMRKNTLELLVS